jgi:hypothetical protein
MSITSQPRSNLPGLPPMGVSGTTLIVSLILSQAVGVCATALIILGVLYFRPLRPGGGGGDAPLEQHGTVSPQGKYADIVYYPIPFGLPPNLKLTSAKPAVRHRQAGREGVHLEGRAQSGRIQGRPAELCRGKSRPGHRVSFRGRRPQAEPSVRGLHLGGEGSACRQGHGRFWADAGSDSKEVGHEHRCLTDLPCDFGRRFSGHQPPDVAGRPDDARPVFRFLSAEPRDALRANLRSHFQTLAIASRIFLLGAYDFRAEHD